LWPAENTVFSLRRHSSSTVAVHRAASIFPDGPDTIALKSAVRRKLARLSGITSGAIQTSETRLR